jgi:IS30 family transposase
MLAGAIAVEIKVHASTISRELKRNQGQRGCRPKQAHEKALQQRQESFKCSFLLPFILTGELRLISDRFNRL